MHYSQGHEDYTVYHSLPASESNLGSRLAVLFGTDQSRFTKASDIQKFSGIAPA